MKMKRLHFTSKQYNPELAICYLRPLGYWMPIDKIFWPRPDHRTLLARFLNSAAQCRLRGDNIGCRSLVKAVRTLRTTGKVKHT